VEQAVVDGITRHGEDFALVVEPRTRENPVVRRDRGGEAG
jgi:hypothetical protein